MSLLKKYRVQKGLSQNELANVTGVSVRVIQNYEQKKKNLSKASVERLYRFALTLGCPIQELLSNKDEIEDDCLKRMYREWRRQADIHNQDEDKNGGTLPVYWIIDCAEECVREDFSNFANLDEEISFEDMRILEQEYKD